MGIVNLSGSTEYSSIASKEGTDAVATGRPVERQAASKDTAPVQQVQATQEIDKNAVKTDELLTRSEVESLAKNLSQYNNKLSFKVNEYSKSNVVIEVRTVEDDALVRQIPYEEVLTLNERLSELDGFDI